VRTVALLGLWVLLIGADPVDLFAGAVTAAAAAWVSLRLLPAGAWRLRPGALAALAGRLLRQAAVAGADVAWRAFHPRLPLRPGLVSHRLRLAPGPARDAFRVLASLLPGTVAAGLEPDGALRVHCLDVGQPVAEQLAADEARLARALGADGDG
jgi:multicomponent Na+:H+ antiporter subunit E